ncbi:MAG: hypothetical protein AAGA55_00420 [Planctomycetota bacterium]
MLVPTLPASRLLILDDGDLPAGVCVALAAERLADASTTPVLVPSWWRGGADETMPLVHKDASTTPFLEPSCGRGGEDETMPLDHKAVERHARLYDAGLANAELVVEPGPAPAPHAVWSQLLMAAVRLAHETGCDAVLFPVRPDSITDEGHPPVEEIAREVDRAALITRLAALDYERPCAVLTPLVDLTDLQVLDLAYDMAVSTEGCWWAGVQADPAAASAGERWTRRPAPARAVLATPGNSAQVG